MMDTVQNLSYDSLEWRAIWQKQHSTRRRLFSPANGTKI